MSDEQVTITFKQLLIFLGIVVVGVVAFSFVSQGKKAATAPATSGRSLDFLGEKGATVKSIDGKIYIDEGQVSDGNMHNFNYYSEKEDKKIIYFFIVKASDGTYRAAANACEVCFKAKKGFKQVGDLIRCENCQITYPKDKIALQKGGCNPGPIDKDVAIENGKLVIDLLDLEKVAYLF